jgi:hypothetical protein
LQGRCQACEAAFEARLIHNGFNDSAYAYCAQCGTLALCSLWKWPASLPRVDQGPLASEQTDHLRPCSCGGRYTPTAGPRCPKCRAELDAEAAWHGLYALMIGGSAENDPWEELSSATRPARRAGT